MDLLNEIVKLLSDPVWSGIGVLVSSLFSVIALVLAFKSPSKPTSSQQEPLVNSTAALSFQDQGTSPSPQRAIRHLKRPRKNRQGLGQWINSDDDPPGGVPDMFLPPSYWND